LRPHGTYAAALQAFVTVGVSVAPSASRYTPVPVRTEAFNIAVDSPSE